MLSTLRKKERKICRCGKNWGLVKHWWWKVKKRNIYCSGKFPFHAVLYLNFGTIQRKISGPKWYISWLILLADNGPSQIYRYRNTVYKYASMLKLLLRLEKKAWTIDLKWHNNSSVFNNYWVKYLLFGALKFGVKFAKMYDILPPLRVFVTSTT